MSRHILKLPSLISSKDGKYNIVFNETNKLKIHEKNKGEIQRKKDDDLSSEEVKKRDKKYSKSSLLN